jgi:hypothetical protein
MRLTTIRVRTIVTIIVMTIATIIAMTIATTSVVRNGQRNRLQLGGEMRGDLSGGPRVTLFAEFFAKARRRPGRHPRVRIDRRPGTIRSGAAGGHAIA